MRRSTYWSLALSFGVAMGCNALLGNEEGHLKSANTCTLNSECAQTELCIFATCSVPCRADVDCDSGSRCLEVESGAACVASESAKCETTRSCPDGTVCSSGACRTPCSGEGGVRCHDDQICASVCVGTDKDHDPEADDPIGSGGQSGTGGRGPRPTGGSTNASGGSPACALGNCSLTDSGVGGRLIDASSNGGSIGAGGAGTGGTETGGVGGTTTGTGGVGTGGVGTGGVGTGGVGAGGKGSGGAGTGGAGTGGVPSTWQGPAPTATSVTLAGTFTVQSYTSGYADSDAYGAGTIYYPTNAPTPVAGVAIVPGFLETQSAVAQWGPFLASHGFIVMIIDTNSANDPDTARVPAVLATIGTIKGENTRAGGPVFGKLAAGRLGVMGHSMGGGGALLAANNNAELDAAIGLTPYFSSTPALTGMSAATLIFGGTADSLAPPSSHGLPAYNSIPVGTSKAFMVFSGGNHFVADTPTGGTPADQVAASRGLSWLKLYLDGDTRYTQFIATDPLFSSFQKSP